LFYPTIRAAYEPNSYNIAWQRYDHRTSDPCSVFSYDNIDRLTVAEYHIDDTNEVFTMDKLGNRTAVNVRDGNDIAYTVDNLTNRYRKVADANLAYDAAGNLTRDRLGYEYACENRTIKITSDGTTT